jgi:hypothetical protein
MARRRRIAFDGIWVRVSREKVSSTLIGFIVALHQVLNEINKMKRLSFSPPSVAEADGML